MAIGANQRVGRNGERRDEDGRTQVQPAVGIADTLGAQGSTAAAPAIATTIVTLAAPPAGTYEVEFTTGQSGTPDANALNINLRKTAVFILSLPSTAQAVTSRVARMTLDGSTTINLAVGAAAGGAGAVYYGAIRATRVA